MQESQKQNIISISLQKNLDELRKTATDINTMCDRSLARAAAVNVLKVLEEVSPKAAKSYTSVYGRPLSWVPIGARL